jgi:hypothetical protein
MQETPPNPENPGGIALPCRHLRNKEMYYQGNEDDECASGIYWCARTQEAFGPDSQIVGKNDCCAGRSCFIT